MTLKKRGLGRGLEVLLADTSSPEEVQHAPATVEGDHDGPTMSLIENLQKEKQDLLHEAEALKLMIDEFELIIRAGLQ